MILPFAPVIHRVGGILGLVEVPRHQSWIISRCSDREYESEKNETKCSHRSKIETRWCFGMARDEIDSRIEI
jgi:hypothetical protein